MEKTGALEPLYKCLRNPSGYGRATAVPLKVLNKLQEGDTAAGGGGEYAECLRMAEIWKVIKGGSMGFIYSTFNQ